MCSPHVSTLKHVNIKRSQKTDHIRKEDIKL